MEHMKRGDFPKLSITDEKRRNFLLITEKWHFLWFLKVRETVTFLFLHPVYDVPLKNNIFSDPPSPIFSDFSFLHVYFVVPMSEMSIAISYLC